MENENTTFLLYWLSIKLNIILLGINNTFSKLSKFMYLDFKYISWLTILLYSAVYWTKVYNLFTVAHF